MKELIMKALKGVGLSEDLWEKISVTSSTEIESAVASLAKTERESNVRKVLKEAGLEDELDKIVNSEADSRSSKAVVTATARLKTEFEEEKKEAERIAAEEAKKKAEDDKIKGEKDVDKDKDKGAGDAKYDEVMEAIGALTETVAKVTETVTGVQTSLSDKERDALILDTLKTEKISPEWADFVTETEPDKIKAQIQNLKGKHAVQKQIDSDALVAEGGVPAQSAGSKTFSEQQVADYAKNKTVGVSPEAKGLISSQIAADSAQK